MGSNTSEGQECSLITTIPHVRMPNVLRPLLNPIFNKIERAISGPKLNEIVDSRNMKANEDERNENRGVLQLILKKTEENPSHFVSYKSLLHTMGTEYSSQHGTHTISTELTLRDELLQPYQHTSQSFLLGSISNRVLPQGLFAPQMDKVALIPHAKSASHEILSNLNSSSKTSVQYTFLKDDRTSSNPMLGSYIRSSLELAVPSGVQSAQYLRTDLTAQTTFKVQPFRFPDSGMIASFSGSLG